MLDLENIAAHEQELITYSLQKLSSIPGIRIFGEKDPEKASEKVGVIPF